MQVAPTHCCAVRWHALCTGAAEVPQRGPAAAAHRAGGCGGCQRFERAVNVGRAVCVVCAPLVVVLSHLPTPCVPLGNAHQQVWMCACAAALVTHPSLTRPRHTAVRRRTALVPTPRHQHNSHKPLWDIPLPCHCIVCPLEATRLAQQCSVDLRERRHAAAGQRWPWPPGLSGGCCSWAAAGLQVDLSVRSRRCVAACSVMPYRSQHPRRSQQNDCFGLFPPPAGRCRG
jgi:hypothetical protein